MVAPCLIAHEICRLVENKEEGVPNSERIFHDYDKAFDAMYAVYLSNGDITAELADRNGDRYSKEGTGKHGGVRRKGDVYKGQWLESRALNAKMEKNLGIITR